MPTRRFARPGWCSPSRRTGSTRSCSRPAPWPSRGRRPATRQPAGGRPSTRLQALIKDNPAFADAYRALAEIHLKASDRAAAIAVLKDDLKANPEDAGAAGQLVQLLSERRAGRPAARGGRPRRGPAHRRGDRRPRHQGTDDPRPGHRLPPGRPARAGPAPGPQAAAKLDSPAAHLEPRRPPARHRRGPARSRTRPATLRARPSRSTTSCSRPSPTRSRPSTTRRGSSTPTWTRARRPWSSSSACRSAPSPIALPGEFFDTLGAIQESVGQTRDAEESYLEGLKKDAEEPGPQLPLRQAAGRRPQPRRQGEVLPEQGPGRPRPPQPQHGPRGRSPRAESQ